MDLAIWNRISLKTPTFNNRHDEVKQIECDDFYNVSCEVNNKFMAIGTMEKFEMH